MEGQIDVELDTAITWEASNNVDGYFISLGTTPNGTEIVDNEDVGNTLTYTPPNPLPQNTEIYVTIIPYKNGTTAEDCDSQSFFTLIVPPTCTTLLSHLAMVIQRLH